MEERIRPTRSGLFAIELLIAVGIFALCAAICVGLFVRAEVISQHSDDLNRAVSAARSVAECYKAAGGDLERAAELTGGRYDGSQLAVYYNQDWQILGFCGEGVTDIFLLEMEPQRSGSPVQAALRVYGPLSLTAAYTEAEMNALELLSWEIAALEAKP